MVAPSAVELAPHLDTLLVAESAAVSVLESGQSSENRSVRESGSSSLNRSRRHHI